MVWPSRQLERDRTRAIQIFVNRRLQDGDPDFMRYFEESEAMIEAFLERTTDLTQPAAQTFLGRIDLLEDIARFVAGPPISADDFRTLLGFKRFHVDQTREVAKGLSLILKLIDPARFPWVASRRAPTAIERRSAVVATASLRAVERARTGRRSFEQSRQETFVAEVLRSMGLTEVTTVRSPEKDLPEGSFKSGVKFEGKQCDILVRLFDERFLAIECKSSNSAVNSIKRLNDVSDKAQVWKVARGAKVVTAGVLAGVFDFRSLDTAQDKSVFLFWEHDLEPLKRYIKATKKAS